MSTSCPLCGSSELHISRFRLKDFLHLLILRYPMRCWVCRERDYFPISRAFRTGREEKPRTSVSTELEKARIL